MSRKYYASEKPRGFANEIRTYSFPDKESRDKYLEDHSSEVHSPYEVSKREALRNVHYKGDAITESFNSDLIPVQKIADISPDDCKYSGGEWVDSYVKRNGEHVSGYCRRMRNY